ncbi:MAG: 50S ribosomal protein L25 [Verrucomicrobiales bacterium]|nr:50S ribosomal protein L25 [Verrucomicrobiales bacterium]|tara:strand:- start:28202 stop:28861 length:660 start_codon:yes stop_codon:yes gene_type:complete
MKSAKLSVNSRTATRRSAAKKLRREGRAPAVIYGKIADPQALDVDAKEFGNLVSSAGTDNFLCDIEVAGDERPQRFAIVKEIQRHPLSQQILHIDFHEIRHDEEIEAQVPIDIVGDAYGVKTEGGLLETVMHEVTVRCLPDKLPSVIEIDVTELHAGHAIHVSDVVCPEGVKLSNEPSLAVVHVVESKASKTEPGEGEGEGEGEAAKAAAPAEDDAEKK